jgi:glyoxylase-like metal-dependent hydrolase (beta-lactamase superfamily II)
MLIKYLYDDQLAQASYVIGCTETKHALVIDPGRDVEPYLQAVLAQGLTLTGVTETHIHADFVSGVSLPLPQAQKSTSAARGARNGSITTPAPMM